jgi:hypothetical protein
MWLSKSRTAETEALADKLPFEVGSEVFSQSLAV